MAYQAPSERSGVTGSKPFDSTQDPAIHRRMSCELVEALLMDPTRMVDTPRWKGQPKMRALDVFTDHMNSDTFALQVLAFLRMCEQSNDPLFRLTAQALFSEEGKIHADWHAEAAE